MSSNGIEVKSEMSQQEAVSYLNDLARALKEGRIVLESAGRRVDMAPSTGLTMEMKAASKGEKESLGLKMSWRRVAASETGEDGSLRIHAGAVSGRADDVTANGSSRSATRSRGRTTSGGKRSSSGTKSSGTKKSAKSTRSKKSARGSKSRTTRSSSSSKGRSKASKKTRKK